MLPQQLGLGRGELAIGQRALPVQRSQRLESGRNPRVLRWRRHDGRVAWSWRAEPVWVMAPRMIPTVMQARRGSVPKSALTRRPPPASACARPATSASASVKALDMFYRPVRALPSQGVL